MFSQLGPLFKTTFRQAESNDTRLAIPHDEREKRRRKEEEEQKKEASGDFWEDNTSVTVSALRAFLVSFLKTLLGQQDGAALRTAQEKENLSVRPPEKNRPTNTQNAKAVRAYQSMAEKTQSQAPAPSEKKAEKIEPTADLLQSEELRDIHKLIDDLEELEREGVQDLQIQKANSFIDSMKNAVKLKKSKL
jgi:hypothetical protein